MKILFLVTEDWYFCIHRLPIARMLRDSGWDVVIVTRVRNHRAQIEAEGFRLIPLDWDRRSLNPFKGLINIIRIIGIYKQQSPDLVHLVAIKPSVYGSIAAVFFPSIAVVNNLAGLGHVFSCPGPLLSVLRKALIIAFRILFNRPKSRTIVENSDDRAFLVDQVGVKGGLAVVIRGIGIDVQRLCPTAEAKGVLVAAMVSRMIQTKGVADLVAAAGILRQRHVAASEPCHHVFVAIARAK